MRNVHGHALLPDGVFVLEGERYVLVPLAPPEEPDLCAMTARLARRVTAFLERRYLTLEEGATDVMGGAITEAMSRPSLPLWARAAEDQDADADRRSPPSPRRYASVDGFSIHADTSVSAQDRLGLEKLCRYGLRPAFSHERLSLAPDGQVVLGLRRPWPNPSGARALVLEPLAFLRRLASLTPPPYAHLIRHYGLFAPSAKGRDLLPPAPLSPLRPEAESTLRATLSARNRQSRAETVCTPRPEALPAPALVGPPSVPATEEQRRSPQADGRPPRKTLPWHELLRRLFAFDVRVCPRCAGPMTVIAYLTESIVLEKILTHLGLPTTSPPLSPARRPQQLELGEAWGAPLRGERAHGGQGTVHRAIRGPPPEERGDSPEPDDGRASLEVTVDEQTDWGA